MAHHGNLCKSLQFFSILRQLELISQSRQPSQNPAKDPRGTSEHGTSTFRRRPWNFKLSFLPELAKLSLAQKSHLRRGGRTWYPECNCHCAGHTWRIKVHNGPHYIPQQFCKYCQGQQHLFNPVHPLIEWVSTGQMLSKVRESATLAFMTSHVMHNHISRLRHHLDSNQIHILKKR